MSKLSPLQKVKKEYGSKDELVAKVAEQDGSNGYNALTDTFEDLIKAGVITPAKVDRSALQNAASVATVLLTADCIVTEVPADEPEGGHDHDHGMDAMGGMGGMGGMPGMGF